MNKLKANWKAALLFILPALCLYSAFLFVPVLQSLVYAFTKWDGLGKMEFIGLDGFIKLLSDDIFLVSLRNNIYLLLSSVFGIIPLALLLAIVLNQGFKGYRFFRTVYFIPNILSTVVVALIWMFIYNPQFGLLNMVLKLLGLESFIQQWLADSKIAIFSVLVVNCWQHVGTIMIILLAGLKNIPNELYEAVCIDGASEWVKLVKITIPLLWETVKVTIVLAVTGSMKAFDLVFVLTQGGPGHSTELMATYMYKKAFISFSYGYGSTLSFTIFALSLLLTFGMQRMMRSEAIQY